MVSKTRLMEKDILLLNDDNLNTQMQFCNGKICWLAMREKEKKKEERK